jgi:hypothetical protein
LASPAWLAKWMRGYGGNEEELPPDLKKSRSGKYEHVQGYLGDLGTIAVFQAVVARGESYLIPIEALAELTFTRFKNDSFVQARTEDVEGKAGVVDLRLAWQYSMKLDRHDSFRITVAAPTTSGEAGTR